METIKIYLDNMFLSFLETPQVMRAKRELFDMMEDKYQELRAQGRTENDAIGMVISEFGNLEEMAQILGISEYRKESTFGRTGRGRFVSMGEAREYIEASSRHGIRIGLGVMLCILSPIMLIILSGAAKTEGIGLAEPVAEGLGILILLILVAAGVACMIMGGFAYQGYEKMKEENIFLDVSTENYIREEKADFQGGFAVSITLGVVLCVLSALPICMMGLIPVESEFLDGICVGILLFMVSVGVFLFIMSGVRKESYDILLREGEYAQKAKQ